jgi:4-oxalocrotonate tautomerase
MPFAQVYMIEGRTEEQKRALIEKVTQALVEASARPRRIVRVWIHDVPKENWGIAGSAPRYWGGDCESPLLSGLSKGLATACQRAFWRGR